MKADLLKDILPVSSTLNASTVKNHLEAVACSMEKELKEKPEVTIGCGYDWAALPKPDKPFTNILLQFNIPLKPLATFEGSVKNTEQSGILFTLHDYLELVDYTGRIIRLDKRGRSEAPSQSICLRYFSTYKWIRIVGCGTQQSLKGFTLTSLANPEEEKNLPIPADLLSSSFTFP